MKILVVEDEPKTGDYLKQGLVEAGFIVDLMRDGRDGYLWWYWHQFLHNLPQSHFRCVVFFDNYFLDLGRSQNRRSQ